MADTAVRAYARVPDKVSILEGVPALQKSSLQDLQAAAIEASADGRLAATPHAAGVDVYDIQAAKKVVALPCPSAVFVAFSPKGSYLVTCQRASKSDGQSGKNLQVWEISSGTAVLELSQKSVNKEIWPMLQWSSDESTLMHLATNTIHIYSKEDNFSVYKKAAVPGATSFAVSPGPSPNVVAVFLKEHKGSPAATLVLDVGQQLPQQLVRRGFYRSQGAKLMWNSSGTALLAMAYTDTDATNQSYYGEQQLHYLPSDPSLADLAARVPLPKDGPVHDVQWAPNGDYFVVVAGFMPAKVVVFDAKCKPVYDLGSGPYNVARWNPFGRFLAIAGFGNLPGDIVFFDKKADGKCKQMGAVRSPSVDCSWSPDGRHLLTAVTAPRLRVDNGIKVYTYYGELVKEEKFEVLYEAGWLPSPPGTFSDRPQSPQRLAAGGSSGAAGSSGKAAAAGGGRPASATTGIAPPARAAGYVPPHLRGDPAAAAAAAARFSLAYDEDDTHGKISSQKAGPPGAAFVSKAASKNAKKRANKKKSKEGGGEEAGEEAVEEAVSKLSVQDATAAAAAAGSSTNGQEAAAGDGGSGGGDVGKKIRALQKKLRQIQQLKDKLAAQGPSALEPEQLQKIKTEEVLMKELKDLGGEL